VFEVVEMVYEGHQVVLQSRPGRTNPPTEDNFAYVKAQPIDSCKDGEIVAKTLYLSVDPYMRFCMNDHPTGLPAFQPWPLNEPPCGNGVGQVVESKHKGFAKGDIVKVELTWPWKNYVVLTDAQKVCRQPGGVGGTLRIFCEFWASCSRFFLIWNTFE